MASDSVSAPGAPSAAPGGLDVLGWYIAVTHEMLGHDKAAAVLGQPPGNKAGCLLCAYERERTPEARAAVIGALAPGGAPVAADAGEAPLQGRAR